MDSRFFCRPLSTLYGHAYLLLISSTQPSYSLHHSSTGPSLFLHSSPPSPSGPSTTITYIGHPLGQPPPPWTSTLAVANPDLQSTHRRSSWTLTAALSRTLLYYIYPFCTIYISSYTIYITTTPLDPLSPPGPSLSTEPSPPFNLSILYIPFYTIYTIAALPNPHRLPPGSSPPPFASTDVLPRPPDFLFFLTSIAIYLSYVAHHLFSILHTIYHATYNYIPLLLLN